MGCIQVISGESLGCAWKVFGMYAGECLGSVWVFFSLRTGSTLGIGVYVANVWEALGACSGDRWRAFGYRATCDVSEESQKGV